MPTVHEIEQAIFRMAPKELAMSWDNVGMLVGRCGREVTKILVALDVTQAVAEEAVAKGCQLIVAHHPLMNCNWSPVQTLRDDTAQGKLLLTLIENGVAAICMHTNLDAAEGGVNDTLAAALGLTGVELLGEGEGIGRMGALPEPMSREAFLAHVGRAIRPNGLRWAGGSETIRKVAVGGGACGGFFPTAVEKGCDAFVTSDVKYNQFLDAADMGLCLVDAGHYPTEDVVCPVLVDYLREQFPALTVVKSDSHREIMQYVSF